jgi:hypothetical protein
MNIYLFAAGSLTIVIGLVHSILGEIIIFNRLRYDNWIPTQGGSALREFQVRILWASWHVVSVLGWALAAILLHLSNEVVSPLTSWLALCLLLAFVGSSALVLVGTRGRHPGWIGLLAVAVLIALA